MEYATDSLNNTSFHAIILASLPGDASSGAVERAINLCTAQRQTAVTTNQAKLHVF